MTIVFFVHKLSQYIAQPHLDHLDVEHYLLRYLKNIVELRHLLQSFQLKAFVNFN